MSSVSNTPETVVQDNNKAPRKTQFLLSFLHLPTNVYLLLFFTLGKGFQLTIATLTLNYYAYSLGYHPDFIGLFSAMPAIGALIGAVPFGMLADRLGRKPVLVISAILTPLFLAMIGLVTAAPLLLALALLQGVVSTAYWVTNLPLLVESTTENQRVGVLALNSFLLLGVGALGNLLGGAIPEFVAGIMHVTAASTEPLRWGVLTAASFTFVFGLPLWFLRDTKRRKTEEEKPALLAEGQATEKAIEATSGAAASAATQLASKDSRFKIVILFVQLLLADLLFTMGEGAVVALIQLYFVLRFHLLPGPLGVIFTVSGVIGGVFALTAPLFVKRWSKLRVVTTVQYVTAPLMVLIGFAPNMQLAIAGEYARSFLRMLIDPVYAAFAMEQVSDRHRGMLSGLYSVTWSIGFSIGPSAAGWLQDHVSLSASFVFGAACLVICPSLLLVFFGRRKA
ncbi:MFS transporter [Ktedonosporobacter rubrisoli]|uniref:MFS transporter n=1 Tax=Ktedonosporobacter rubrisoli TaxID=2509675 RepID=A0A4P6K008_KTERU|nr:MFS transporter [Ktedonosporobacter rubrisoli]QBD81437.1 MFS transporter [Ktedonosporobacter rubrisoli]